MNKMDRKIELIKKLQDERDHRTWIEEEVIRLISNKENEKACALMETIDNETVKKIERELDALKRE